MSRVVFCLLFSFSFFLLGFVQCSPNYKDALLKSILFFQGQRSGRLPTSQKITWRSNSGLSDGSLAQVDLTGGYYDAGDNVKFNFPMAFTTTILSWGTLEYGNGMGSELQNAKAAIRWATEYLLKCARATPGKLYVGVGDPNVDHKCWERPEDMDTVRSVYSVSARNPGSDVAGETAAALAAASIVFRTDDPTYSKLLLNTAKNVLQFALQYKGAYSDSLGSAVCPFYCSYSGYKDELLWGAAWLLKATNETEYYNLIKSLGADDRPDVFSWDNKYAGAHVLLSSIALLNNNKDFEQYKVEAENFMCKILPNSPSTTTQYTKGQRSGRLPTSQKITWRSNSGLSDGSLAQVDLTGGYYDAGDNVKFNFPMAFTTTILSWGTLEYGNGMGSELQNAKAAIRWATEYLLKCARATPGKLYVGVGDPNVDHKCWERPEDMDTVRSVYSVSARNPGSDVAGETAAALAAASIVFRTDDPTYSKLLLNTAKNVLQFALQYKGAYSDSLGSAVCPFYCSYSGYKDELLWGAAWLLKATNETEYYNLIKSLGADDRPDVFSWDNKYAGAHVLLSSIALLNNNKDFEQYKVEAENFMCKILPNSPSTTTQYTKGGLMYKLPQSNLEYVTSITFLLTTYAKYMKATKQTFNCGSLLVTPDSLLDLAKRQASHCTLLIRGSSLPSIASHKEAIGCDGGFQPYYYSSSPNPNVLTGAIVGGPDQSDNFSDERSDYSHSEPATYINAAFVGPLAYFAGNNN
ncbi:hypothetical protein JCGZ_17189 [Jatropha curcas]|uniref:Endoglucanase n=1 Tax=Jatropha curcas TaxID=180498 RepID=A0A067LAZ5_JATCU|nr:hypothetical protein JCGZ_17189 [Jatropha curcas]